MEAADFPVLGLILVQKCQAGLVKFLEELVPTDLLQTFFLRAEIDVNRLANLTPYRRPILTPRIASSEDVTFA
jgi:hypothetical protein